MATPVQAAVQAATYDEFFRSINSVPGQLPGESVEAWLQRTGFERAVAESGAEGAGAASHVPVYKWDFSSADEFDRVVRETTADGAWENWEGAKSAQGAAGPAPSTGASPQTAIKSPGAAGAAGAGLLSVPLPTWVAAAAPLLGVAVGVGLYELSPEFWTKVSKTLLPFCYDDTQVMPVIADKDGNTYVDKEAVEALKKLFEEEGIGQCEQKNSNLLDGTLWEGGVNTSGAATFYYYAPGEDTITMSGDVAASFRAAGIVASSNPNGTCTYSDSGTVNLSSSYTYDGKTVYYKSRVFSVGSAWKYSTPPNQQGITDNAIASAAILAWTMVYGSSSGGYVEGTSKWNGTTVDISQLPITEAYTDPTKSDTRDFIPVALPTTPGQSVNPEENPDPTKNEDTEAQISPYINPSIGSDQYPSGSASTGEDGKKLDDSAPIPLPYPPTQSQPKPDDNPSDKDDTPPQRFVDIIPPIDSGDIDLSPIPSFGTPTDGGVGGLVSIYNPTYSELQSFSQWLWVTYQDATIDKIWNNPFDGIISLYEIYCTPSKGARKYIKSGFLVSPVECITIPQRYVEINCGTAVFPEYYGNYLDYSPYSKALVYLPFIGIMELNVDDIVGHAVNITYRVDTYTGGCIAILTCAREGSNVAMYQFSGNCSVQLPIAGGTQASIRAAQISAGAYQNAYHTAGLAGLAGGLASAFFGGANFVTGPISGFSSYASNEAMGQANATSQTVSAKSSVQHSGQFGESYGAMGHKKPYMIIKRPVQVIVPGYQQVYGFQSHKMVQIGACTGYLRCRAVHVVSAQASDEEKNLIEKLLVSGVYVTE